MNKRVRICALTLTSLAAFGAGACGSIEESSPTAPTAVAAAVAPAPSPSPAPGPTPAPEPAPAPTSPGKLDIAITPNPVPWSNDSTECSLPNAWQYDQILTNTGGTQLTISDRVDSFDGAEVSRRSGLGIVLAPGADTSIRTRWCSANAIEHRSHTTFRGADEAGNPITTVGSTVRLLAR